MARSLDNALDGNLVRLLLIALLVVGIGAGVVARFNSLDDRPLAVDEYYSVRAASFIVESGLPRFPDGGYYVRGLLPLYLSAGFAKLLGEQAIVHRIPVLLANLLSLYLAYVYARRFTDRLPAAAVGMALALSSWQIEFSHFARMYSAFQCVTLLFLIAVDDAYFGDGWRRRYWPHVLAVVAVLTHFLGILLVPFLFLPLVDGRQRARFPTRRKALVFLAAGLVTAGVCYFVVDYDFRDLGVRDKLPGDFVRGSSRSDCWTPRYVLWSPSSDPSINLVLLGGTILAAAAVAIWLYRKRALDERDALLGLLLVVTMLHAFLLSMVLVIVLFLRYPSDQLRAWPQRSRRLLLASAICAVAWLAYASVWVTSTGADSPNQMIKSIVLAFFGWPQLYHSLYLPWSRSLPVIGALLVLALAYLAWTQLRRPPHELLRSPVTVVVWVGFCLTILRPTYSLVRYAFFIYPVILTVIALSFLDLVRRLVRPDSGRSGSGSGAAALGSALFLLAFAVSFDFNPRHIRRVRDEAVVFRSAEYERFSRLWYSRDDFESPGEFVERQVAASRATRIVVVNQPPVSYYLRTPHGVYYDRGNRRFTNVARKEGTSDLWSGQALLGTRQDLRSYTADAQTVWVVRTTRPQHRQFAIDQVWTGRLVATSREFVNADGTIEVVRVTLKEPAPKDGRDARSLPTPGPVARGLQGPLG